MWKKIPKPIKLPILALIAVLILFLVFLKNTNIAYITASWIALWAWGIITFHSMGIDLLSTK